MATEDSDLVKRCQDGDQAAFRELVEKHRRQAYWIARDITSDSEAARDISQEAFIRAFKSIRGFDARNSFAGWLRKIVTHLAIDELRSRARRQDVSLDALADMPSSEGNPNQEAEAQEQREMVIRILGKLPPKYRAALSLRDIHGMSYEEIAHVTSCPRATVRWRIHNARRLFKDLWERWMRRTGAEEAQT